MLQKNKIILLFFLLCLKGYSQHLAVIHNSGYKHDYVVGKLFYLEDIKDTSKLHYIATLQITDVNYTHKMYIVNWFDLIEPKAVEMGANTFKLSKYETKDSLGILTVKIYFGGEKFLKENDLKKKKDSVFIFDFHSTKHISAFYLNGEGKSFKTKNYFAFKIEKDQLCSISLSKTPQYFSLSPGQTATFLFFLEKEFTPRRKFDTTRRTWKAYGIWPNRLPPDEDLVAEMDYILGRLVLDMYKQ